MKELTATRQRIGSIDLLRGIVMVVMALDHVRDFFHDDAVLHNPLDLQTTTPALFFTRWVTHFCAPVFLFLAGTSAYLMGLKRTKKELGIFLIKRGFWLIFIELAIITLLITFNPFYNIFILQVIWATGVSMIILGLLVRLPYMWILIIALCIVFGHNLLDHPEAARQFKVGFIWDLLHNGRFTYYPIDQHHGMVIAYAFIPWTGLMLLGYCMGRLFAPDVNSNERRRRLFIIGSSFILLFIIVRFLDGYGDPVPWSQQSRGSFYTFLSFINVNKYPPSLMYVSVTIGPALIFLALAENWNNAVTSFFTIYGRVPFFYYVIHFFVIHILEVIILSFNGFSPKDIVVPQFPFRPDFGFGLVVVYLVWMLVILIMYPLCKKYNEYKSSHRQWWLSYL